MEKEIGFYMIYLEYGNHPTRKHYSYDMALREAKRLTALTDRKAYILKTKTSLTVKKEFEELKLSKPDEDALPF